MPGQNHHFNGWSGKAYEYWLEAVPEYFLKNIPPEK